MIHGRLKVYSAQTFRAQEVRPAELNAPQSRPGILFSFRELVVYLAFLAFLVCHHGHAAMLKKLQ